MIPQIVQEVEISRSLRDYVERLHYETQAARDTIVFMLMNNLSLDTDAGEQFQKEFIETTVKYEEAKQQLTDKFVPEEYKKSDFAWNFDFRQSTLVISKVR